MRIWTYGQMAAKVLADYDLEDETFISPNELAGYHNEAISDAEAEIIELQGEYFKTKYFLPWTQGVSIYNLPVNIYANKIRGIMFSNGSTIYPIVRYKRQYKFQDQTFTDVYGQSDDYRYDPINDVPGQAQIEIKPAPRETAILYPAASLFTPAIMWYIRNCSRVPLIGEYCNTELIYPTQLTMGSSTLKTFAGTSTVGIPQRGIAGSWPGSIAYVTGDAVQLQPGPGGTLPAPLVAGTTYYVIQTGAGIIQFATTYANAIATTAITLTGSAPTMYFTMQVAATQNIQNATLIDIPEFSTYLIQYVKCCSAAKENGGVVPPDEAAKLIAQKKQMIDSLTNAIPDDDDEIQGDFSLYQEMS